MRTAPGSRRRRCTCRCGCSCSACPPAGPRLRTATARWANTVVINPTLELLGEEQVLRWEGCLSIPGLRAAVPRHASGALCRRRHRRAGRWAATASGFHAGVVQHEYDHLDGILYPMRMTDFSLFGFAEEARPRREAQA